MGNAEQSLFHYTDVHYLEQTFSSLLNTQELLSLAVGLFAIVLVAISLLSYRRTKIQSLLFVSIAFALFAFKTFIHHLNILIFNWGPSAENTIFTAMDFAILLLFFFAVVIRVKK
jgi:hypothetical protein